MKINEIFYSLQGEGYHTGRPAVFVRFSGCNRACDFCDTDFSHSVEMTPKQILNEIAKYPAKHVVLTGGEPTLQVTKQFIAMLKDKGYYVQIETNGSMPMPYLVDWVTCSPKAKPWRINPDIVDELKIVYQGEDVEHFAEYFDLKLLFLQPCSGENIPETIDYILAHPHWRLSLQTHKLINIP